MLLPKHLLIAASYLLIGVTGLGVAGCQTSSSSSYGDVTLDRPVKLAAEGSEAVILVSLPSAGRKPNPQFDPKPIRIDPSGQPTALEPIRSPVQYTDTVSGDSTTLHLLGFDLAEQRWWIADPEYQSPQFWRNPQNPSQLLFQPQYNLGGLYLLNTNTLEIKPLGNHKALGDAIAKTRALPPSPPPPNCKESECEAGVRILYWASDPSWSLDGAQIAFTSNRETLGAGADMSIWVLDVATSKTKKVIGGKDDRFRVLGWTAEGKILAWEYSRSPDALVAVSPATGGKQVLLEGDFFEFLALSDNYQTLLYASRPRGENASDESFAKLYAFSPETGNSQLLFEETETARLSGVRPDFSSNGDRIVAVLNDAQGGYTLLAYHLKRQVSKSLPLPPGKRLFPTERKIEWAGEHLVVPLEDPQTQTLSTLLMAVEL